MLTANNNTNNIEIDIQKRNHTSFPSGSTNSQGHKGGPRVEKITRENVRLIFRLALHKMKKNKLKTMRAEKQNKPNVREVGLEIKIGTTRMEKRTDCRKQAEP